MRRVEIHPIRDAMRKMAEGKKGGVMYVPVIGEREFEQYKVDGTVVVDDPGEEGKNVAAEADGSRPGSPKRKRDEKDGEGGKEKRVKG